MSRLQRLSSELCAVVIHNRIADVEAKSQRFKGVRTFDNCKLFVFTDSSGANHLYAVAMVRKR